MKKIYYIILSLCLIIAIILGCTSCGNKSVDNDTLAESINYDNDTADNEIEYPDTPYIAFAPAYDYPMADSVTSMTEQSTYVVIATCTGFVETWNMMRNPNDPTQESDDLYAEGHIYSFSVEEVLKGTVETETILVNQEYYETRSYFEDDREYNEEGEVIKEATWRVEHKLDCYNDKYIEPEIGTRYILFLDKGINYYGACEPFLIKLDGDSVELCSNIYTAETLDEVETNMVTEERTCYDGRDILFYESEFIGYDFVHDMTKDAVFEEIEASVLEHPDNVIR